MQADPVERICNFNKVPEIHVFYTKQAICTLRQLEYCVIVCARQVAFMTDDLCPQYYMRNCKYERCKHYDKN